MLIDRERRDVVEQLADVLSTEHDVRGYVKLVFNAQGKTLLQEMNTSIDKTNDYAEYIVGFCVADGWTAAPSMLEVLLARLIDVHGRGALSDLRTRVRAGIDPNPDPFDTQWVLAQAPFLGRKDLRARARLLLQRNQQAILRVVGERGSGLTYTCKLLDHLSDYQQFNLHVVRVELQPDAGPSYEVKEIADWLTTSMQKVDAIPERSGSSYSSTLCRWVLRHAMNQTGMWVFVLDGFGQDYVKSEVKELIQQLAKEVTSGDYRKRLRVVLIDEARQPAVIPALNRAEIMSEEVPPAHLLGNDEVMRCLEAHNAGLIKSGKAPLEKIEEIAASILASAPSSGKPRLEHVYNELLDLASMNA